jgi:lipopolysaccharide/colanic/teichoic acid biosynthesis glycosyltransferase
MRQGLDLDIEYVQRQSFALDMAILIRTIPAVFTGDGAR